MGEGNEGRWEADFWQRGRESAVAFITFISPLITVDLGAAGDRSSMVPSTGDAG